MRLLIDIENIVDVLEDKEHTESITVSVEKSNLDHAVANAKSAKKRADDLYKKVYDSDTELEKLKTKLENYKQWNLDAEKDKARLDAEVATLKFKLSQQNEQIINNPVKELLLRMKDIGDLAAVALSESNITQSSTSGGAGKGFNRNKGSSTQKKSHSFRAKNAVRDLQKPNHGDVNKAKSSKKPPNVTNEETKPDSIKIVEGTLFAYAHADFTSRVRGGLTVGTYIRYKDEQSGEVVVLHYKEKGLLSKTTEIPDLIPKSRIVEVSVSGNTEIKGDMSVTTNKPPVSSARRNKKLSFASKEDMWRARLKKARIIKDSVKPRIKSPEDEDAEDSLTKDKLNTLDAQNDLNNPNTMLNRYLNNNGRGKKQNAQLVNKEDKTVIDNSAMTEVD